MDGNPGCPVFAPPVLRRGPFHATADHRESRLLDGELHSDDGHDDDHDHDHDDGDHGLAQAQGDAPPEDSQGGETKDRNRRSAARRCAKSPAALPQRGQEEPSPRSSTTTRPSKDGPRFSPSSPAAREGGYREDAARPMEHFDRRPSVRGHRGVCALCSYGFLYSGLSLSLFAERGFVPPPAA